MSDFTIEQLEALKEGTTPWPWGEDVIYPDCSYIVDDTGGRDAALAFTAPALVDALIAEKLAHQKLRAEIQRLQGSWSEWRPTRGDEFREGYRLATETLAGVLARVLEADNG